MTGSVDDAGKLQGLSVEDSDFCSEAAVSALANVPSSRQPRRERNHRSRAAPCSLIRYCRVPLPEKRLSSKPNLHSLLKYDHAERGGRKLSCLAASPGPSHASPADANKDKTRSLRLLA